MPGVGEARAQHPLVAGDDGGAAIRGVNVCRERKPGGGLAGPRARGEIALVHPHGHLHDLWRQVHESIVDTAKQRHRPFHQAGHFLKQTVIRHDGQAAFGGKAGEAVAYPRDPVGRRGHHVGALQLGLPVCQAGDGDRLRVAAVALCEVRGGEAVAVIFRRCQRERNHGAVQQADDAAERAYPGERAGAAPAHRFRPGETAQQPRQGFGHQVGGLDRGRRLVEHPEAALLPQHIARGAVLAQEASQRLFGRGGARAALDAGARDTRLGDRSPQRKAAWPMEQAQVLRCQGCQSLANLPAKQLGPGGLQPRRYLLAEKLQEKLRQATHPAA